MSPRTNGDFRHPAMLFVNGFGDQLMALPAIRALSNLFGDRMQTILGEGMLSFFYHGLPMGTITRAWWQTPPRTLNIERIVNSAGLCDLFLSLSTGNSASVLELARRMGATRTVGFFPDFDDYVPMAEYTHQFDQFFSIPQRLQPDLRFDDFAFPPAFSPAAELAARRFVDAHCKPGHRILFVHPETLSDKMWHPLSMSWALQRFLGEHSEFFVFVASVFPYPLDLGSYQARVVPVPANLELALAIVKYADLFFGIDSCFLHAADLFRVPGVALFGPTDPQRWGFRFSPLSRSLWGRGTMAALRREDVLDELLNVARNLPTEKTPHVKPEAAVPSCPKA
jgi:hypothetical protein